MKYAIYFYEGQLDNEDFRSALTLEAVSAWCTAQGIEFDPQTAVIQKGEKGNSTSIFTFGIVWSFNNSLGYSNLYLGWSSGRKITAVFTKYFDTGYFECVC